MLEVPAPGRRAGRAARTWPGRRSAGPGVIEALVGKGLVRKSRAADRARCRARFANRSMTTPHAARRTRALDMNADQLARLGAGRARPCATAGSRRSCSTASPAAARPSSTCGRSRRSSRQGKEAIVLVPEISLTPQTIERFRGRCGDVAVLHSHLGDAERGGHWRRVAAGAGAGRRRRPQRRLRADAQARPDRHRRGARDDASSRRRRRATTPATWPSCAPGWRTSRSCSARRRRRWRAGTTPSGASTRC